MSHHFHHFDKIAAALICSLLLILGPASSATALDAMPPGSLKAFALSSANPRTLEHWASQSEEEQEPLQIATHFAQGETAYAAVLVTGYTRNADNQVDLDASFRFYNAEGKLLFRRDAFARLRRTLAVPSGFLLLTPALDIGFDGEDPPGDYQLEFEINDNVSHRRTRTSLTLTLEPPSKN